MCSVSKFQRKRSHLSRLMSVQSCLQANEWTRQPINVFLRLRVRDASRISSQLSFTTRDLLDSLWDRVIVPEQLVASCLY